MTKTFIDFGFYSPKKEGDELKLLNIDDICEILRIGKTTIWNKVKKNKFPQPIRFGQKNTRWRLSDILQYIDEHAKGDHKNDRL